MEIFETNGKFVVASEKNGQFTVPVRGESFTARTGRDLSRVNLAGAYVYKTEAGAKRALRAMEQ